MRAIVMRAFGPPDVLEIVEQERPEPAVGEVLVRVGAVGLNPVEAFARKGSLPIFGPPPMVLGWDVAGVVEACGPSADGFDVGELVFGLVRFPRLAGAYAEYVTAPVGELARPPAGLDAIHAAALPLVGLTAWQSLVEVAAVKPGQHVLVHAGGGGVGHIAVQLAKALGARVTATASEAKHAFVKSLGADTVIDYRTTDLAARVNDADVVLDPVGGPLTDQCVALTRPGGVIVSLLRHHDEDDLGSRIENAGRRFAPVLVRPDAAGLAGLAALVTQGKLRIQVERTFGFEEIAQAHRLLESSPGLGSGHGIRGKLVAVP